MTLYEYEGSAVLVKPPIQTESALVKDAVTINPGDVVIRDANTGKVDKGVADSLAVAGVAVEKRVGSSTEKRPVTFVTRGRVRCVADGAITAGRLVKAGASGKVKEVNVTGGDTFNEVIGRYVAKGNGKEGNAADGDEVQVDLDVTRNGGVA